MLSGLSYYAFQQRNAAQREARAARAALSAQIATHSQLSRQAFPQKSMLLAVEALNITDRFREPPVAAAEEALRQALSEAGGLVFGAPGKPLESVELSPDGRWLATAAEGTDVRLWNVQAGASAASAATVLSGGKPMAFSANSRWLVTTARDGQPSALWDSASPDPATSPRLLPGAAGPVTFSADNRWLITGGSDGSIRLWNLRHPDVRVPIVLPPEMNPSVVVALSPNSRWLATSSWTPDANRSDTSVARLWDSRRRAAGDRIHRARGPLELGLPFRFQPRQSPAGHEQRRAGFAHVPQRPHRYACGISRARIRHRIPACYRDTRDRLPRPPSLRTAGGWSPAARTRPRGCGISPRPTRPPASRFSRVTTTPSAMSSWEPTRDGLSRSRAGQAGATPLGPACGLLASGRSRPVTARRLPRSSRMEAGPSPLSHRVSAPTTGWLLLGSDAAAFVVDLAGSRPAESARVFRGHEGAIAAAAFASDGRTAATGSADGTARLWRLSSADVSASPAVVTTEGDGAFSVSASGRWLLTIGDTGARGRSDSVAVLRDLRAQDVAATPIYLADQTEPLFAAVISQDERWIATAGSESDDSAPSYGSEWPHVNAFHVERPHERRRHPRLQSGWTPPRDGKLRRHRPGVGSHRTRSSLQPLASGHNTVYKVLFDRENRWLISVW